MVVLCVAMSLDGKIGRVERGASRFGSRRDLEGLLDERDRHDALLTSAGTLRAEDPLLLPGARRRDARRAAGRRPAPVRVVVSGSLQVEAPRALRPDPTSPRVLWTTTSAPASRRAAWRARGVDVESFGDPLDLAAGLRWLRATHGVTSVHCEGGGVLAAALLAQDLIRELRVTVCPVVIGGARAPTPIDGDGLGLEPWRRAKLETSHREGDEVFLHYTLPPRP